MSSHMEPNSVLNPITLGTSAPVELFFVLRAVEDEDPDTLLRPGFPWAKWLTAAALARVRAFWSDGGTGFSELLVLADQADLLAGAHPGWPDLLAAGLAGADPPLASESPAVRRTTSVRLDRLRQDSDLRGSYLSLIGELWSDLKEGWDHTAQPAVASYCTDLQRRKDAGATLEQLVPRLTFSTASWRAPLAEAVRQDRLYLVPSYFSGMRLLSMDLPKRWILGFSIDPQDTIRYVRQKAERVSRRLKVLSDPTRVAILIFLGHRPSTVTEITAEFALAQPTVSGHVRELREAGLLLMDQSGRQTTYTVDRRRLAAMIDETAATLLDSTDT